jgi:CRP-like cAMP-binding protein
MRKNQFDRLEYKKEFIMLIGKGEIFGEEAMLNFTQNYSIIVQSQQCVVLRIDHSEFLQRYSLALPAIKKYSQMRFEHIK